MKNSPGDVVAIGNIPAASLSPVQVLEMALSAVRSGKVDPDCIAVVMHKRETAERYSTTWVRIGSASDMEVVGMLEYGKSAVKAREGMYTDEE